MLQITLIPGLIFNRFFTPKGGPIFRLATVFLTSLLLNFLLVNILLLINSYSRLILLIIISVELFLLIFLYRRVFKTSLDHFGYAFMKKIKTGIVAFKQIIESSPLTPGTQLIRTFFILVITILSLSLIWWFFRRFINNFATVFNVWDAVISWNTWPSPGHRA